jgi:ABC-type phosphate transport system auxiliary subunit
LNESLQKRYPDSVSGMIRAASYSESNKLQLIKQYQNQLQELTNEINDNKEEYQRNLRSLRQEYEQLKTKYETVLKDKQGKVDEVPESSIKKGATNTKVVNLSQAQARIR